MAQVKRVYYDNVLVYPLTITDAVVDVETGEQLSVIIKRLQSTAYGLIEEREINEMIENDENSRYRLNKVLDKRYKG